MVNKLLETVSTNDMIVFLVLAFVVGFFIYKEWPELKRRISQGAKDDAEQRAIDKDVREHLDALGKRFDTFEQKLVEIDVKLARDYNRINDIDLASRSNRRLIEDSLDEREIIMRALLGALGGLQELGANGPTKAAQTEIKDYLNRQAHRNSAEVHQIASEP